MNQLSRMRRKRRAASCRGGRGRFRQFVQNNVEQRIRSGSSNMTTWNHIRGSLRLCYGTSGVTFISLYHMCFTVTADTRVGKLGYGKNTISCFFHGRITVSILSRFFSFSCWLRPFYKLRQIQGHSFVYRHMVGLYLVNLFNFKNYTQHKCAL